MIFAFAALMFFAQDSAAAKRDCLGVVVKTGPSSSRLFVSFAVGGTEEQLAAVRKEALAIGAKAEPPGNLGGRFMLFVFFESTVKPDDAVSLYNRVNRGEFHPGVPPSAIMINQMTLPAESCSK